MASVVEFGKHNRSADIGFGVHEPGGYAVGISRLGVGGSQPVEKKAVLHTAYPAVVGRQAMQCIGSALFDYRDYSAGGMAVFGGQSGSEDFYFFDGVLNRLDADGAAHLFVGIHAIFEQPNGAVPLAGDVIGAE